MKRLLVWLERTICQHMYRRGGDARCESWERDEVPGDLVDRSPQEQAVHDLALKGGR